MFRLPEIIYPLAIDTIGKRLAMGDEASIHCLTSGCGHEARLNLVALGQRLGFDHSCMVGDIAPYFYCPKCRAAGRPDKRIGMIYRAMTREHSAWPRERQMQRERTVRARAG